MEDARDTGRRISLIRKATMQDIDAVAQIYEAVHDAEEAGALCIGWDRSVYPVRQTALAALAREDLFVEEEEGAVVAAAIINQTQVPEYALCSWEYPAQENEVMVLHTLVVDPRCSGRGLRKNGLCSLLRRVCWRPRLCVPAHGYAGDEPGRAAAVCQLGLSGAWHCAMRVQRDSRCTAGMPGKETGPGNAGAVKRSWGRKEKT